ncbi:restriction endonuclease subunit S [Microbacterium sp. bgisy207]|jgi:type I restriction enzyme S subunit|uniref:restriction endonuclease subunit S n=1 Tax=Microbacterium sp. bgisy207 TaxID=3413800 RepID=UPI003EC0B210
MFTGLPKYKATRPVEFWSTAVPAHWQVVPGIAVIAENKARNTGVAESQVLSLSHGRVIVKPVEKQRGLVPDSYEGYQILEPEDIVIRPTDLQNDQRSIRVGRVRDRGIITSAYIGLRSKHPWTTDYAYHYLAAVDSTKRIYGMGSGLRQQLGWPDLKRMPCLVPPVDEQAAIVKYLAHASARIDKAIAAKRRLIALLEEERSAITGALMDLPSAPLLRTKDVCLRIVDCKNRTPEFVEDGEFHVVRTTCVRGGQFTMEGSYPTDHDNFVTWTERGAPKHGDVFFTREAPAGEAALVPARQDLCMGQRMMYFRPNLKTVLPEYLLLAIYAEPARRFIAVATNGSTVGHLRIGDVGALPVRVPSLDDQRRIVSTQRRETSAIVAAKRRIESEIELLREFRTRLVADVVIGQLDVRDIAKSLPELEVDASGADEFDEIEGFPVDDLMEMSEV